MILNGNFLLARIGPSFLEEPWEVERVSKLLPYCLQGSTRSLASAEAAGASRRRLGAPEACQGRASRRSGEKDLGREAELREKGRTHRLLTGRAGW